MADWNDAIIEEFRRTGGTVEQHGFGRDLVLVHHVGARTGAERVSPVRGIPTDDGWLIAASKGGAPTNPQWFYNLLAHPDVTVETPDDGVVEVRAERLVAEERDAGWRRFTELPNSSFASYEAKTTRVIPVLLLRRR
ncbi:nitroreductase/quinone reductase family protein [Rathayibacter sp. YIM 133350]|uniref:nitroreductase/quinone reductase family protein n=1 Tax=Rathayibacter sp. YIM 133350 TaxID=3131992 RepID=UPI00307F1A24